MKAKNCFTLDKLAFEIALDQQGPDRFIVVYGKQVKRELTYSQAASELGACIMHALACEGKLNNAERK